ncbi:uncharacterized protein LOC103930659 [Pyrus x bretschneideri]|uniref:uncharacterized protein LOC103930659 n=1 Tax=Pyrus x bretschneideri TaxID=225117 RepID=UPI002030F00D|nr:uncharacterized protein LOC103930659 [Pyrus x bretschneideri]
MADNNISVVNSNPKNTTTTFQPFFTIVNIKLDRTNYPLWLAQMLPILKSRDLIRYVDGTLLCPPKHVANSTTVNPVYTAWTKKGDISMADYLDCMNAIADNLALAGQPVSDEELVQIVLNNLRPAFEMTVSAAQARDTPIAYPTLESLMLTT